MVNATEGARMRGVHDISRIIWPIFHWSPKLDKSDGRQIGKEEV